MRALFVPARLCLVTVTMLPYFSRIPLFSLGGYYQPHDNTPIPPVPLQSY
jgi:hypothetical protein